MKTYNFITVCILILLSYKEVKSLRTSGKNSTSEETFLYFAYGSNLLAKRIHINNPTAKFFSIAKLPNFRLDFEDYPDHEYWNGSGATIVEDSDSDVWGALWTFNMRDKPHLDNIQTLDRECNRPNAWNMSSQNVSLIAIHDLTILYFSNCYVNPIEDNQLSPNNHIRQEDVSRGTYQVKNVSVQTPDGKTLIARTYQMTVETPKVPPKDLPPTRQPSNTYMKVILDGAFECSLPMHYIRFLSTFRTNGKLARCDAQEQLGHPYKVERST